MTNLTRGERENQSWGVGLGYCLPKKQPQNGLAVANLVPAHHDQQQVQEPEHTWKVKLKLSVQPFHTQS